MSSEYVIPANKIGIDGADVFKDLFSDADYAHEVMRTLGYNFENTSMLDRIGELVNKYQDFERTERNDYNDFIRWIRGQGYRYSFYLGSKNCNPVATVDPHADSQTYKIKIGGDEYECTIKSGHGIRTYSCKKNDDFYVVNDIAYLFLLNYIDEYKKLQNNIVIELPEDSFLVNMNELDG